MFKIFVGGFPLDMDEMGLAVAISPFGDIATVKLVRDKKTRICKGYGFVEMKTEEGARAVMAELNGVSIGDREWSVKQVIENTNARKPVFRKADMPVRQKRPRMVK
jgi:RNA recognition motif-containing protein